MPPDENGVGAFDPLNDEGHRAMALWYYSNDLIVEALKKGLEKHKGHLVLVSDTLPTKAVAPMVLDHVPCSYLRLGVFTALDYRLEALRPYEGAAIFVPDALAAKALVFAPRRAQPGRPHHPGRAWYRAQGFDRAGRTINQIQNEMFADGIEPPSESAIREWETKAKKNRQKPGPENSG